MRKLVLILMKHLIRMTDMTHTEPFYDVLVTGSRYWSSYSVVAYALDMQLRVAESRGLRMRVTHGNCPTGADHHAQIWATVMTARGVVERAVDADWGRDCGEECYHRPRFRSDGSKYCPLAGHVRNQTMVDYGAEVCLAFPTQDSRGTKDCARRAKKAGIPVVWEPVNPFMRHYSF